MTDSVYGFTLKEKQEPPPLFSKFEEMRVVRGFTEISYLWDVIEFVGKGIICGGYVRYMCSPRKKPIPASDVDIYAQDEEAFKKLRSTLETEGLKKRHENDVSLTFHQPDKDNLFMCPPVQLIKPMRIAKILTDGSVQEIINNFDFSVIRIGLLSPETALADERFPYDEYKLTLRLRNIHCPVSSTLRCCKYASKGYWLPPMQALRLFLDWEERTPKYKQQLADFLAKSENQKGLSKEDIEQLEAMMMID